MNNYLYVRFRWIADVQNIKKSMLDQVIGWGDEADGTPTDLMYIVPDLQRENLSFRAY